MDYKYLPENGENKLYTPAGVQSLFKDAVAKEDGNIQAVFDKKNKYKSLIELWYASPFAVVVYKQTGNKFSMLPSDSPDIHFVRLNEKGEQEGFSMEIMTLFRYGETKFDGDYKKLAESVWKLKGEKDYDRSELLLVSRLTGSFDLYKFAAELKIYKWKIFRILLSVFNNTENTWTFFEVYNDEGRDEISKMTVALGELPY